MVVVRRVDSGVMPSEVWVSEDSQDDGRHAPSEGSRASHRGPDVVVESEEVAGVVAVLEGDQPVMIGVVSSLNLVLAGVIAEEVHVTPAQGEGTHGLPQLAGPADVPVGRQGIV